MKNCLSCGKPVKFGYVNPKVGISYRTFCSRQCSNQYRGNQLSTKHKTQLCMVCDCPVKRYGNKYPKTCSQKCAGLLKRKLYHVSHAELFTKHRNQEKSLSKISQEYNIHQSTISRYMKRYNIKVKSFNSSLLEEQILDLIRPHNISYELHDRSILNNQEIDILLPDFKLAIEVNGTYFHGNSQANAQLNSKYHLNKTEELEKKGIHLIHIFEHEWKKDPSKIKNLILSHCKIFQNRIYARNCIVKNVDINEERNFLNNYHLQGYCASKFCLGLYFSGELISLMSFCNPRFSKQYDLELLRLCTKHDYVIFGGAEKMFCHAINKDKQRIISYCNRSKFKGDVYNKLHFKFSHYTKPNYIWVLNGLILTRYQTQKKKLSKLLGSYFDATMSEDENMFNSHFCKIWDCGQKVFVFDSNS